MFATPATDRALLVRSLVYQRPVLTDPIGRKFPLMGSHNAIAVLPALVLSLFAGCEADETPASVALSPEVCEAGELAASAQGITFAKPCEGAAILLVPRVKIDGAWRGGGGDGVCSESAGSVACPAGDAGRVVAEVAGSNVVLRFEASRAVVLEALSLEGTAQVPGATAWLSNGFQSWSQSGMIALGVAPSEDALAKALAARGDGEVDRYGNELSWWYTYAGGGSISLFAGATTGDRFRPWAQMQRETVGGLRVRLVSGATGEKVAMAAGQSVAGETWRVQLGTDTSGMLASYGKSLPTRRSTHPTPPLRGWNSWYELWDKVTENDVRANAALVPQTAVQSDTAPVYVVVDDGWQKKWGEWEANEKFPSGIAKLASDLKAKNLRTGVWLAPLLVQADSVLVTEHPDWFVQGAEYPHATDGMMRILDVTQPEAAAHLSSVIATLVSWGLDLLKIDFLFAGTFEGKRFKDVTGMQAYGEAMRLIREAAGETTVLVAVGSPPIPTFLQVDAWRMGGDIAFEPFGPSWYFLINQARSLSVRWPLCFATLCDADPPLLRKLPTNEVDVGVWVAAAAGGALFLSDDLPKLPPDRLHWALSASQNKQVSRGIPMHPQPQHPSALPATLTNAVIDQVTGKSQHAIPSAWVQADGTTVVLNFTDSPLASDAQTVAPHTAAERRVVGNE